MTRIPYVNKEDARREYINIIETVNNIEARGAHKLIIIIISLNFSTLPVSCTTPVPL